MNYIKKKIIMTSIILEKTLNRMVTEVLERNHDLENLVLIGLQTRGVFLAERIRDKIKKLENVTIPVGVLDISLYRDDFAENKTDMCLKKTDFPFSIDEKKIILVDDVLHTGRSVRAAMECIMDFGRPKAIRFAALIDRGHRELPIQPDFVGKKFITIPDNELISVNLKEIDGKDCVILLEKKVGKNICY
ncbi:bifunctional pyr operon transcriptional regulator/uracil phosphoribosyltransferase PyrR [bacterium]